MARCGGGFFHSPGGLLAGAPHGDPLFLQLREGNDVVGISVATRHGGHWGLTAKRTYMPSIPAFAAHVARDAALSMLLNTLGAGGGAIVIDSFDASQCPAHDPPLVPRTARTEFVISLTGSEANLAARCHAHHRRHIRRGERDGWTVRMLSRSEGERILRVVHRTAADRGTARGEPFNAASHHIAMDTVPDIRRSWGIAIFSAWLADSPLAAAVIGYANGRGYYISGGSTPGGYERDASIWLHWKISAALADAGFTSYNLGGIPERAIDDAHPMHGLYRFKLGFGAQPVTCRGVQQPAAPASHLGGWFMGHATQ
jgi:hypothetical protein